MNIYIKLTHRWAKAPKRSNPTDAGADLFSPVEVLIPPHESRFVDFGVQLEIPEGYCGLVFARSGLGGEGIRPRNCVGVIDSKYRGNIGMMVENAGDETRRIYMGDRISQLVIVPIELPEFRVVNELCMEDDRMGGFGSSGK